MIHSLTNAFQILRTARTLFLLSFSIVSFSSIAVANQCVSGDAKATQLLDQMAAAAKNSKSPAFSILQAYKKVKQPEGQSLAEGICTSTDCKTKNAQLEDLRKFTELANGVVTAPGLLFKSECLIAAAKYSATANQISCPSGVRSKSFNFCLNRDFLDYQNAVISQFKSCADKSGIKTLNAENLFKMYTLESGFKPHYAYPGGVGIGQLTSIFVNDLHQPWRGRKYLQKIATSKSEECKAARMIAEKDLATKPNHSDNCAFVSVGEGLERNVLYSILGTGTAWEKDIEPKLASYLALYKDHPQIEDVKNLALLNSYGPGRGDARAAIERLTKYAPDRFLLEMKKPLKTKNGDLTKYIQRIEARQNDMATTQLGEPLKSGFGSSGVKACLNSN